MGRIPVLKELHGEKELQELAVAFTVVSDRGERTEMISRTLFATRHEENDDGDNDNDDLPFLLFQQWLCRPRQTTMNG